MVELASKCKQLTTLNLGGHTITVAAVVAVAREAPQLESLGLNSCYNITDVAVVAVSLRCTQLSSLDLRCCSKTTDLAVVAVGGLEVQAAHDARPEVLHRNYRHVGGGGGLGVQAAHLAQSGGLPQHHRSTNNFMP